MWAFFQEFHSESNLISMMIPKCLDYYGFILSTN